MSSEVERLLIQCGLPQYYPRLQSAGMVTFALMQEKKALLPSVLKNGPHLKVVLDALGARGTAATRDEDGDLDGLRADLVWEELQGWERRLRAKLRLMGQARAEALMVKSDIDGRGTRRQGQPTSLTVRRSELQEMQRRYDHMKTLLAMTRQAMRQHRANKETVRQCRSARNIGALPGDRRQAEEQLSEGQRMVKGILTALLEDGPTLMDMAVVSFAATGERYVVDEEAVEGTLDPEESGELDPNAKEGSYQEREQSSTASTAGEQSPPPPHKKRPVSASGGFASFVNDGSVVGGGGASGTAVPPSSFVSGYRGRVQESASSLSAASPPPPASNDTNATRYNCFGQQVSVTPTKKKGPPKPSNMHPKPLDDDADASYSYVDPSQFSPGASKKKAPADAKDSATFHSDEDGSHSAFEVQRPPPLASTRRGPADAPVGSSAGNATPNASASGGAPADRLINIGSLRYPIMLHATDIDIMLQDPDIAHSIEEGATAHHPSLPSSSTTTDAVTSDRMRALLRRVQDLEEERWRDSDAFAAESMKFAAEKEALQDRVTSLEAQLADVQRALALSTAASVAAGAGVGAASTVPSTNDNSQVGIASISNVGAPVRSAVSSGSAATSTKPERVPTMLNAAPMGARVSVTESSRSNGSNAQTVDSITVAPMQGAGSAATTGAHLSTAAVQRRTPSSSAVPVEETSIQPRKGRRPSEVQ